MDTQEEKTVLVYVTKYALTQGIFPREGRVVTSRDGTQYFSSGERASERLFLKLNVDCFESRGAAKAKASEMATRKVAALKKQISKLEKLAQNPKWA